VRAGGHGDGWTGRGRAGEPGRILFSWGGLFFLPGTQFPGVTARFPGDPVPLPGNQCCFPATLGRARARRPASGGGGGPAAATVLGMSFRAFAAMAAIAGVLAACSSGAPAATPATSAAPAGSPSAGRASPAPAGSSAAGRAAPVAAAPGHTVIVVMENHAYSQVIASPQAPFINQLARQGALFTNSRGVTHPSEPNYLALFSGTTQGITDDSCPHRFTAANLGSELIAAGRSFAAYSEDLPAPGSPVCASGGYARKHAPWANFANVPASDSKPMHSFPAGNYARLPAVSFVIPNLCHDMHDCPVATGDAWLRAHLAGYVSWAAAHASLLIVTWDENDDRPGNQIPTIFAGPMVRSGQYSQPITHYNVLGTIENLYRLPALGHAATAAPISGIWK
jgi:phosphatidylinositol-3-phosphatase